MISAKMQKALNKHLNEELFSSYLYLSMAAYFEGKNFKGFANWMKLQSNEEYGHAMKFYTYILQVGGKVTLTQINTPKAAWKNHIEVFKETLEHEKMITDMINSLVDIAILEKDHATNNFLQWFVNEQVEEIATAEDIVNKLDMIGDNKNGLFMVDRELGARTAV